VRILDKSFEKNYQKRKYLLEDRNLNKLMKLIVFEKENAIEG